MNQTVKQFMIATACISAIAVPLTAYAYLQKDLEQPNNFIIEEGKEEVTEEFISPEYMSMQNSFTKKVSVENTGTSDQFVRVYLDFSDSCVRDTAKIVCNTDKEEKSWDEFLTYLSDNSSNLTYWVYIPESEDKILGGYFYYTKILKPKPKTDETSASEEWKTSPLIQAIKTNFGSDSNVDNITDFDIIVYSESIQTVELDTSGTVYKDEDWKNAWKSFLSPKN